MVLLIIRLKVHEAPGEGLLTGVAVMDAQDGPPHAVVIALHLVESIGSNVIPSVTLVLGGPTPVESLQVSTGQTSIKYNDFSAHLHLS